MTDVAAASASPERSSGDANRDGHDTGAAVILEVDGLRIQAHRGEPVPTAAAGLRPGIIVAHAFPTAERGARFAFLTFPELAERIAHDTGCVALAIAFRGCGDSEGDASAAGWLADVRAGVEHLRADPTVGQVFVVGFGIGAAVAFFVAASDGEIGGVGALGCPADLDEWASDPRRMLEHCRSLGVVRTPGFPADLGAWARELAGMRPIDLIARLGDRPALIVHGVDDETTPAIDARALADAAHAGGAEPELRLLAGAGHDLRHDPRAIAILLGWIARLA